MDDKAKHDMKQDAKDAKAADAKAVDAKAADAKATAEKTAEPPSDGFTNPVLVEPPPGPGAVQTPDATSNPAACPGLGSGAPAPEPGVVQTTIDGETTTVHPKATITNRVEPATATLKGASNKEKK